MSYAKLLEPESYGIYPIQKHDCPKKGTTIITTNDGNKTQRCTSCNWVWRAPGAPLFIV